LVNQVTNMLFSFINYLQHEKRVSPHTLLAYQKDLEQFQEFLFSDLEMDDISKAGHSDIRAWMISLIEQPLSPGSINRKIATLRSFYKFLLSNGSILKDPTYKIQALKKGKRLPSFVPEPTMEEILDEMRFGDHFEDLRDKMILEILYLTGMRLSELIGLKWAEVDLYECQIKVTGKGNKNRIIPLSERMKKNIIFYKKVFEETFSIVNSSDYFIVRKSKEPAYPMMIYRVVRKNLDLFVKTSKRSPHVLRHTFATHLLNKGADLNAVKDLLGHASLAATQVYTHNSIEKLKAVFTQAHPKA
jgi:integrase/recombinase XerC